MKEIYSQFAYIYDKLMYDVDYKAWADYIEQIFKRYNLKPMLILDLACGTGNFTIEMAKRKYSMIGVDISFDMLSCANEKKETDNLDILFLNQNMVDFELYGTVDAIVCLMDSVNYITSKRELQKLFKNVHMYLNPGGIFIFDINTIYKMKNILSNNVFYDIEDDISYIWQSSYNNKKRLCEFDVTFFAREGKLYKKFEETHIERGYEIKEIGEIIKKAKLQLCDTYRSFTFKKPNEKCDRIFFVCKK